VPLAGKGIVGAPGEEAVEDAVQVLVGDAGAVIGNGDDGGEGEDLVEIDVDGGAGRCEACGVVEEVLEDLVRRSGEEATRTGVSGRRSSI
jgi:hypothetical protein